MRAQESDAAVAGCVVYDDDLVLWTTAERFDYRREILRKQVAPIPVRYHYAGAHVRWPAVRRKRRLPTQRVEHVGEGDADDGHEGQDGRDQQQRKGPDETPGGEEEGLH